MTARKHQVRLALEQLEGRRTPGALLGGPSADAPVPPSEPPALAAAHAHHARQHAVPIRLSGLITSDGSGVLRLTGNGGHLGRFTGQGVIANVTETAADQIAVSGRVTITAANGDRLFVTFSVSLNLRTGVGEETLIFTGGTGRFAGTSGKASLACETTFDPATPLKFEANCQGSGTLVFDHSR